MEEDLRTVWCGNLSDKVTEEILYELFLQAGPVERIVHPKNIDGRPKPFAFIKYEHDCSAPYAVALFQNTSLFGRKLSLNSKNRDIKLPKILKKIINAERQEKKEPASWKEQKLAKTVKTSDNCNTQNNNIPLQFPPLIPPVTDFDGLLQMGQQMMFPGIASFSPVSGFSHLPVPGFPPLYPMINNCNEETEKMGYPSQIHSTGFHSDQHNSHERSVRENYYFNERNRHQTNERGTYHSSERDNRHCHERDRKNRCNTRPYDLADHRNRDRKYSSSHTLGHRERR